VFATLRRAVLIKEQLKLAGHPVLRREWNPGIAEALVVV
jgi:hypothetical protein